MNKVSILMVTSCYRGFGGAETVMNNLCIGLKKIDYDTAIGAYSFLRNPPDNIEKINLRRFRNLKSNPSGDDFDIVHSHQPRMNYCSLFTPKPFVSHYHGTNGQMQKIYLQISMLFCKNHISRIISVSNAALTQLQKMVGKIPADVIYNGVDTNFFRSNLSQPYKKGDPQLLFVGNLYPTKNVPRLIDMMSQILQLYPHAHLQILGDGKDYSKLNHRIKKKQLESSVELVGNVSDEELRLRYSSCDLYISASKYEAFVVPPMEAMACGKPLILSDIEPHQEIINLSKAGLTFSLSDNSDICKKIQEVYKKKEFGSNARHFIRKYDWTAICKQVASVYDKIMTQS